MRKDVFIICIIFLMLCMIIEPGTATFIQNAAVSDVNTPITIKLTESKIPLVNEETIIHIEVNSIFDAPGTNVKIVLPPDVELVSGSLERNVDLQANRPESFETIIKFTQPGNFKITASAHKAIDLENSWGDMDILYLTIGTASSSITTFGPIAYAERAQSVSGHPEISTTSQNLNESLPLAIPSEILLDHDVRSAEPNLNYSLQNSPNNSIQGTGTLTVTGSRWYYTKTVGGQIADYRDTDNTLVPLTRALVTIYDATTGTYLGYGYTDYNGVFSINIANPYPNSFKVYVWAYSSYTDPSATTRELRVVAQGTTLSSLNDVWAVYAGPFATTDGSHTHDIGGWYPNMGGNWEHAFMLFQDLIRARDFIGWDVGSSTILWYPTSSDGEYYRMGGQIHLTGEAYKSADTSIHEFGHNYMWTKKGYWTNTCPSPHYINAGNNTQCAYTEGWPDFLPLAVNGNPTYTWASGSSLNFESPTWGTVTPYWENGDGVEGRVAGALWDMYDNVNDGYDKYQFPYSLNDATMRQNTGWKFSDFWNTWNSLGYSPDAGLSIFQNTINYIGFPQPSVTSISPTSGSNTSSVHTTLSGNYFLPGAVVGLTKNGQVSIMATNTAVNSLQQITCDFNLTDAEAGQWNVVVLNPDYQSGILSNGFTIFSSKPVVDFSGTPREGAAPLTVEFTDKSTLAITSWSWSFGDGNITDTNLQNPVHTYLIPGRFTVSLTVTNASGTNTTIMTNYVKATGNLTSKIGIIRGGHNWFLDNNGNGAWDGILTDRFYGLGQPTDVPVAGDWNGDGTTEIGIVRESHTWYLDYSGNGTWDGTPTDKIMGLGRPGDIMVTGDWNGDNTTEIGLFRDSHTWYLDHNNNGAWDGTPTDKIMELGRPGDIPVTGDWNGDGTTEIGVVRESHTWYLDYSGNGTWDGTPTDKIMGLGRPGDIMVTGDWDANGITEIGVFRGSHTWYLDNNNNGTWDGTPMDILLGLGQPGDIPVTGKW